MCQTLFSVRGILVETVELSSRLPLQHLHSHAPVLLCKETQLTLRAQTQGAHTAPFQRARHTDLLPRLRLVANPSPTAHHVPESILLDPIHTRPFHMKLCNHHLLKDTLDQQALAVKMVGVQ